MSSSVTVNILQQSTDFIERFAHSISKDLKGNNKTQTLEDLASYVLYFSKATDYYEASDKIFLDIVKQIDSATKELDVKDVLMQFNERIENVHEEVMNEEVTEKYTNFKSSFLEQNSKIDDDITTICQNLNTIDPVSKLPITNPVKNKKCGHVYEKRTIIELIEHNPRTKCPIVGCNAVEYLKKSDLVSDTAMKRMITQSEGNAQKKARLDK